MTASHDGRDMTAPDGRAPSGGTVAGLVLAAGSGRRLGRPKVELTLDGSTFLERAVGALRDGGCNPVLVTADGRHAPLLRSSHHLGQQLGQQLGNGPGDRRQQVVVLEIDDAELGMSRSLVSGFAALTPEPVEAVVVTLVDTPLVGASHVARLLAAHRAGASVAACTWDGARRTPVLLARAHWAAAAALAEGDTGARPFLVAHPELVVPVPCDDLGPWSDVDVAADVEALGAGWIS